MSLGGTDDWAHRGNHTEYPNAAHRADAYLRFFLETVRSMTEYRRITTLIFSPYNGRGMALNGKWKDPGAKDPDSKYFWRSFLGPDTAALGERAHIAAVTENQIASTPATLPGGDYPAEVPKSAKPVVDGLRR